MIFYTLSGPGHTLEIHDDKLLLMKTGWRRLLSKHPDTEFSINDLSAFEITVPKFILWGRVEWNTSTGAKGTFRFSTNYEMMKKIERYMQKKIEKNQARIISFKDQNGGNCCLTTRITEAA